MGAHSNLGVFSDAQEITAAAASTNTINMAQVNTIIGAGRSPFLCIRTAVAPTNTADTLSIEVQGDVDDGSGDASGSWATIYFMPLCGSAGAEVAGTDARLLTAGAWIWRCRLPHEITKRHLRLYYNNTTSNGTFTIDAWLEDEAPSDRNQVAVSPVGQP
jgi:hypothetical protein